jgi:hypothetical protein
VRWTETRRELEYHQAVISALIFIGVALLPFIIYLVNAIGSAREERGIAAGIPKPKQAKTPRRKPREARVRQRRTVYCGRDFTHFALALVGSQDSCKRCAYLHEVPPPPGGNDETDDAGAAVRAAEEIIDQAKQ